MRKLLFTVFICCPLSWASGSITLIFTGFFDALTNLSDSAGSGGVNGLSWGILVDTDGDGFGVLSSDPQAPLRLTDGAELTSGDFFYNGGVTRTVQAGFLDPGDGSIDTSQFSVFDNPVISQGDSFAIIWFDNGVVADSFVLPSSAYGLLILPEFVLPGDGATVDFSAQFSGTEPIRPSDTKPEIQAVKPGFVSPTDMSSGATAASNFGLDFSVATSVADSFSYVLEASTSLAAESWIDIMVEPEVLSDVDGVSKLRLTHPDLIGDSTRLFLRLRVEEAPAEP